MASPSLPASLCPTIAPIGLVIVVAVVPRAGRALSLLRQEISSRRPERGLSLLARSDQIRNGEEISGRRLWNSRNYRGFTFVVSLPVGGPGHPHLDRHRDGDLGGECQGGGAPGRREPQGGTIRCPGQDDHSICVRSIRKRVQVGRGLHLQGQARFFVIGGVDDH